MRTRTKFLFLPLQIKDEVRWLETAVIKEKGVEVFAKCYISGGYEYKKKWKPVAWD